LSCWRVKLKNNIYLIKKNKKINRVNSDQLVKLMTRVNSIRITPWKENKKITKLNKKYIPLKRTQKINRVNLSNLRLESRDQDKTIESKSKKFMKLNSQLTYYWKIKLKIKLIRKNSSSPLGQIVKSAT
jgi:hypothetical protein